MTNELLTKFSVFALALLSGGTVLYLLFARRRFVVSSGLLNYGQGTGKSLGELREKIRNDESGEQLDWLMETTRRRRENVAAESWENRLFHAGFFSPEERKRFNLYRTLSPFLFGFAGMMVGMSVGTVFVLVLAIFGILVGMQLPFSYLTRVIERRNEEISFYLPLVVEQLVIGVSSSLDVGPCVQRVVSMADERDSHNVVTELLRYAQQYVKSGVSLIDALDEIGRLSGNTELKHTFMSLAQVSKHGGEISRQLQELADAVAQQREARIEGRIKRLELEATGPVGLVFLGFVGIFLIGLGAQIIQILN